MGHMSNKFTEQRIDINFFYGVKTMTTIQIFVWGKEDQDRTEDVTDDQRSCCPATTRNIPNVGEVIEQK